LDQGEDGSYLLRLKGQSVVYSIADLDDAGLSSRFGKEASCAIIRDWRQAVDIAQLKRVVPQARSLPARAQDQRKNCCTHLT
jgi:hypothetical protein